MRRATFLLLLLLLVSPAWSTADKPEPLYEGRTLREWIAGLRDEDVTVRRIAALGLKEIGPAARPAVPQLIEALRDEDPCVRSRAADALGAIGPEAKHAVPALVALLPDEGAGYSAGRALGQIGEAGFRPLIDALGDKREKVRLNAIVGLGEMGPRAKPAVDLLIPRLKETNHSVRYAAARVLGEIGPGARAAKEALRVLLKDDDPGVRISATLALARIDPDYSRTTVPALIAASKDRDNPARDLAISALGDLGSRAKTAVPPLVDLLNDKLFKGERLTVIPALGRIGPEAKAAVPDLMKVLEEKDDPLARLWAAEALGRIGPDAKEGVPLLFRLLGDEDSIVGREAAKALRKIDPDVGRLLDIP